MGLIPPAYVRPFVKRQENDAADVRAICEASMMRFMAMKSEETQGAAPHHGARTGGALWLAFPYP